MFKQVRRQPWTCSRCLFRQRTGRRHLVGLATAPTPHEDEIDFPRASHTATGALHDDRTLRKIFDSQQFWKEFSSRTAHNVSGRRAGLLRNKYLTNPEGFKRFTSAALQKCQRIVAKVLSASSVEEYKHIIRDMDRLSDQLCRVIDLVEFIRNVHPDPAIQQASSNAHAVMYQYMNVLNTTPGLDDQLKKASSMPEVTSAWSEEEKVTAKILLKDFAQSGINNPEEIRRKFVEVSDEIVGIGSEMLDEMAPAKQYLRFSSNRLKGMDPTAVKNLTNWGMTTLPTHGRYAAMALRTVEDPEVRREIYMANRTSSKQSIDRVEQLVQKRGELARLSGHESFAHMALSDKMAKTPEAVNHFLEALAADNKQKVKQDLSQLLEIKNSDAHGDHFGDQINAWDRDYYTSRLRSSLYANSRPFDILSSYFSLGTVMQGLSRLFDRLYGIRLVPTETLPGETWNDDVRRLDVIDENEGHIAVLYCDLFERPNKSPNPAHFTLRCSREISASEIAEAHTLPHSPTLSDLSAALNDGMSLNHHPSTSTLHQLPTIAFICDFPRPPANATQPTLLTFRHLSTLFHEMGHALHSILGRTRLQNVAGTRCATDFAELPSVLMEHFAASPDVLSLYARHWETDAPLNVDLVAAELSTTKKLLASAETEGQILLSVLDQRYHSPAAAAMAGAAAGWDSTSVYHDVWNDERFSSVPEPRGTAWQGLFGHLFGYGAVYYSYLFDRAIAGRVWKDVFEGRGGGGMFGGGGGGTPRALDRRQGQRYRDEVLKWGGARDGWRCVAGVLGKEKGWMEEGGSEAMKEVGRWGASEAGEGGRSV